MSADRDTIVFTDRQEIEGRDPEIAQRFAEGAVLEYRKVATVFAYAHPVPFRVHTPEGVMEAEAGDYLVADNPPTHLWPVRKQVFEETYVETQRSIEDRNG